jgi:CRISPR-associated protein Cas1
VQSTSRAKGGPDRGGGKPAILEGQTRQALSVAGFDLACGFLRANRRGGDALVYDAMELARPVVDDRVLDFLQATTLHAGDFTRVLDGSCRLHPQLAQAVVATCGLPQQRLDWDAKSQRAQVLQ